MREERSADVEMMLYLAGDVMVLEFLSNSTLECSEQERPTCFGCPVPKI